ncbi:fumarylacetoacetate hydrolase family protein [Neorhizobium alkalisoli]|uniref:2-keto-4-pentenoate hydratase/2-oxohepta-3-ene-1,7-dioic acid hydratase in catechol pathway n=1 Tax=Neorhizobium alkalisoli TaxID=528178 RepID=A0A561QAN5_9HYPH|nr:fumarylacetoacetate hydrolase family protein [Neorhizobium alkalisoli]TWF47423.1 2-keto-4-pentenoate hydratase/2-oxohepta-3-ene-1,7-dioic acid hydratase in catechol pathway [Neorhizobium alkalisoli]
MRFASFTHDGRQSFGLIDGDAILDLGSLTGSGLRQALAAGLDNALARKGEARRLPLDALTLLPPIPDPARIICVGRNYLDHLTEGKNADLPAYPGLFLRFASTLTGHRGPILHGPASDNLDYEGELAVIIGKPGRHIARADALGHVAGYSCFMDATMRDFQAKYSATIGKNFPSTGGFGPWLTTSDAVGDPGEGLTLETRLNGATMQSSSTAKMIFDLPTIIEFVSVFTPLEAGDVIITGTPEGIGRARKPPVWMRPGDVVEVEIEKVGLLSNTVVAE